MGYTNTGRRQTHFDGDGQLPNYWLVFALVNTLDGPKHAQHITGLFILPDGLLCRVMMLLIAQQYVIQQRALTWEE